MARWSMMHACQCLLLSLAAFGSGAVQAIEEAATGAAIREWPVPWPDTRPRDPAVAPDGRVWFVGQRGNYLAVFDPGTEAFARHDLPEGTAPHTVVVDREGHPWIAGNGNGTILRFDPATATLDTHVVPRTDGVRRRDPHTFVVSEVELPRTEARPRRIALTDDGRVWYGDFAQGWIGAYGPDDVSFDEWRLPSGRSGPYAMASDDQGRIWVVETFPDPNVLQGLDSLTGKFLPATPIPSGGGSVRHMVFDPATDSLWLGTDANTLGRARLPD